MDRRDRYSLRQVPIPGSRVARCDEVECGPHLHGWVTRLATTDRDRIRQVEASGRRYTQRLDGAFVEFRFPPGQQCFAAHVVDKAQLFIPPSRRPTSAGLWVEQFGENQQKLAELQARG